MLTETLSAVAGMVGGLVLGATFAWMALGTPSPYASWLGRPCWVRPFGRAEWSEHVIVAVSWHGAVCVRDLRKMDEDGYWIKKQNVRWRVRWDAPEGEEDA